jgi:hypothetical protein
MSFADVNLYLMAAAVPVVLLVLFTLFRWRYLRIVERVIHAGAPVSDSSSEVSPHRLPRQPLVLVSETRRRGGFRLLQDSCWPSQRKRPIEPRWRFPGS